jgi:bile acid:Na+ symporter, BASS family
MDNISTLILVVALFVIMTGMGLSLTLDDFKRVAKFPLAVFIGILNQIVLLPIIAFLLIKLLGVNQNVAVGIMILAACPGGPTSNLLTLLAKGDKALSVTLTAMNSLITIVTIPLIVNFALGEFASNASQIAAPIDKIAGSLVVVIAFPLAIGMLINRFYSSAALKMDKVVRVASALLLVLVIVGLMIKERENLADYFSQALLIALVLNVTTMLVGFFTSKLMKLDFKQSLTISLESGNQNGTLAIHVASLVNPAFGIAGAV